MTDKKGSGNNNGSSNNNGSGNNGRGNDDVRPKYIEKMDEEHEKIEQCPRSLTLMNQLISGVLEDCRKQLPHSASGQSENSSLQATTSDKQKSEANSVSSSSSSSSSSHGEIQDASENPSRTIKDEPTNRVNCSTFGNHHLPSGSSSGTTPAPAMDDGGSRKRKDPGPPNLSGEIRELNLLDQLEDRNVARKTRAVAKNASPNAATDWRWRRPPLPPRPKSPPRRPWLSMKLPFAATPLFLTSSSQASSNRQTDQPSSQASSSQQTELPSSQTSLSSQQHELPSSQAASSTQQSEPPRHEDEGFDSLRQIVPEEPNNKGHDPLQQTGPQKPNDEHRNPEQ